MPPRATPSAQRSATSRRNRELSPRALRRPTAKKSSCEKQFIHCQLAALHFGRGDGGPCRGGARFVTSRAPRTNLTTPATQRRPIVPPPRRRRSRRTTIARHRRRALRRHSRESPRPCRPSSRCPPAAADLPHLAPYSAASPSAQTDAHAACRPSERAAVIAAHHVAVVRTTSPLISRRGGGQSALPRE